MRPDLRLITLHDNERQISRLLTELVLQPRMRAIAWSRITRQTPNIKIGYPGQHLASLITGVEGERTGARGNDLRDGGEVKSCSRIDQLDKCLDCNAAVARLEQECPECASLNIKRNNDSKWLFTIRSDADLNVLLNVVNRIVLVIGDYPGFANNDFETLRFQAFEIWPSHPRNRHFRAIMENYYNDIYLEHRRRTPNKVPAPKNFWPDQFQFYMCNPIKVFSATARNANAEIDLSIDYLLDPTVSRERVSSIGMPKTVLKTYEQLLLANAAPRDVLIGSLEPRDAQAAPYWTNEEIMRHIVMVNEELRSFIPLRDTDRAQPHAATYERGRR